MCTIRNLRADEIECRPKQVYGSRVMILLYKDARCDMKILDETFGIYGWERTHEVVKGNLFCSVKIRNPETGEWITKQDVGTESNTEKEKGETSDSFKRTCTNIGIGRELYSSPPIWINLRADELNKDKLKNSVHFYVSEIKTDEDKQITFLKIIDKNGGERFVWDKTVLKHHEAITKVKSDSASKDSIQDPDTESQEVNAAKVAIPKEQQPVEAFITQASKEKIVTYITNNFPETQRRTILEGLLNTWGVEKINLLKEKDVEKFIADLEKAKPNTAA